MGTMSSAAWTVRDTGTISGVLAALGALIRTDVVYCPGVSPSGSTEMERVPGVCPPPPVTANQVCGEGIDTLKFKACELLAMCSVCAAGTDPCSVYVKFNDAGCAEIVAPAVTVSCTGTSTGLLPACADVTVTVPEYVPGESPCGLTETLKLDGV
jgi:hypothetical protein